ncbi:16S rRNA (guanine(966)-N(2))-methyltransferase RsmD [Candidatus Acidulodesulfobacterium sp. H_13]|uniref:16S rRNA (guanine(966)-N(2))-methyltransferase RsmD n=1 Tax=Candidatus Acidulodesulfobacterium sp. H_13 TaxID=3395470 RepID=UPI003AF44BD2
MRIISGALRGRKIPNVYNVKNVSPSSDFLKGVLFNMLGADIEGRIFCDLYAGSGNIGFEAISRGSASCVFVEKSPELISIITKLSKQFDIRERAEIIEKDVLRALDEGFLKEYKPDYVFIDPPYNSGLCEKTINRITSGADFHYADNIIVQHDKREILSEEYIGYRLIKKKTHGKSILSFYHVL